MKRSHGVPHGTRFRQGRMQPAPADGNTRRKGRYCSTSAKTLMAHEPAFCSRPGQAGDSPPGDDRRPAQTRPHRRQSRDSDKAAPHPALRGAAKRQRQSVAVGGATRPNKAVNKTVNPCKCAPALGSGVFPPPTHHVSCITISRISVMSSMA
jgi:hypothetical protein